MRIITPAGVGNIDLNGDGKVTIDELIKSTGIIYFWLALAATAVVWGIWILVIGVIPKPITFLRVQAGILAICTPITAYIGINRMRRYERIEEREAEAWLFEQQRSQWEFDQARGISDEAQSTSMTQAQVDSAAYHIMRRYYTGKEWSRDALVKSQLMTAELWNEANSTLQRRRIRKGKKRALEPDTFQEAWGIYCKAKLEQNRHKLSGKNDDDWREAD